LSVQVFLQGKLLGVDAFLSTPAAGSATEADFVGRCHWVSLICEVLPRAILAELGLARILLGWSGGGGFFLVLPQESLPAAEELLRAAATAMRPLSGGTLRLVWGATENLGDWSTVQRRLSEALWKQTNAPGAPAADEVLAASEDTEYFATLTTEVREAKSAGWNRETPATIVLDGGRHQWPIGTGSEALTLARHSAPAPSGDRAATAVEMAAEGQGRAQWGVLRGQVDDLALRIRRVPSVEEYVQLSVLLRQFFAGEIEVQCSFPEAWRKVAVLYTSGDGFALYGAWEALVVMAREIQRLFKIFAEANLKELPGPEGKTISMALELARDDSESLAEVHHRVSRQLEIAMTSDNDCLRIFGVTVEWRQLQHTGELKDILVRMVREFDCPPAFLAELNSFYRDKPDSGRPDYPWRYYRRLGSVLGTHKDRELQRLQKALITDIVGKSPTQIRLRPVGRVAVEWARHLLEA
jgi:CRISPR-associated protein Csm1